MATNTVFVRAPHTLNLQQCQEVLASVLNKAGHPRCFSGLKIGFQDIVDPAELHLTVDVHGGVTEAKA